MATYVVEVKTRNCGGDKYIYVDYETIAVTAGDTIRFENQLTGNKDAYLYAYTPGNKLGPPIYDFCNGEGNSLLIEKSGGGSGEGICNVTSSGIFQYKIEADDHIPLDPIIIIEPTVMASSSFLAAVSSPVGGVFTVAVLAAVAAVSYRIGRNATRNATAKKSDE